MPNDRKTRPHVIRHRPEIFADHPRRAGFLEHDTEVFLALALIGVQFSSSDRRAGKIAGRVRRCERAFQPGERKELLVPLRSPGEGIDAVEPEHMIDAEEMKDFLHAIERAGATTRSCGGAFRASHKRDAPVLAPFLGELSSLKYRLGRAPPDQSSANRSGCAKTSAL
jgi:hypothetical protein